MYDNSCTAEVQAHKYIKTTIKIVIVCTDVIVTPSEEVAYNILDIVLESFKSSKESVLPPLSSSCLKIVRQNKTKLLFSFTNI